jgi:DNA-binding transcriptional MocR family regulator
VRFYPGRLYAFDGEARAALRLTFAAHSEAELDDGVRRLAAAL